MGCLKRTQRKRLRPLKTAKTITLPKEELEKGATYAELLNYSRKRIKRGELGIQVIKFRIAMTAARMLKIAGEEKEVKADQLAECLQEVLMEKWRVKVTCPCKCAELRVSGLVDSVNAVDVALATAKKEGCHGFLIRVGEIRRTLADSGSVWIKCPVAAANKLATAGKVMIGWTAAKVELLPSRPLQCFKCFETGHTQALCKSQADRERLCYRWPAGDNLHGRIQLSRL